MITQKLDLVLLAGKDPGNSREIERKIRRRMKRDGERYLHDIHVTEIEIFGKKIGRHVFEIADKAERINSDIPFVGPQELEGAVAQYSDGLSRNFFFVEQGADRIENTMRASLYFGHRSRIMALGTDLPQLPSLDERIAKLDKYDKGWDIAILLMPIENFGSFRRRPFFVDGHGYKEPQDWYFNTSAVDLQLVRDLKPETKLNGLLAAGIMLYRARSALVKRIGKEKTGEVMKEAIASVSAYRNYMKHFNAARNYEYPAGRTGSLDIIRGRFAEYFGVEPGKLILEEGTPVRSARADDIGFYLDTDSVQDLIWHFCDIYNRSCTQEGERIRLDQLAEPRYYSILCENVQLYGVPILEVPSIKRDIHDRNDFFRMLAHDSKQMSIFTNKYIHDALDRSVM